MEFEQFVDHVQDLSDLELAALLCLVAQQHCLIETADELIDDLATELALISSEVFGLSYAVLSSEDLASAESFGDAILDKFADDATAPSGSDFENDSQSEFRSRLSAVNVHPNPPRRSSDVKLDTRRIVNVVIAKDFNLAPNDVQIEALELVRQRRIFARTTIHPASDVLLFLPLVSSSNKHIRLNKHLVDRVFISHYHHAEDGFANLEEIDVTVTTDDASSTMHIASSKAPEGVRADRRINRHIVDRLRQLGQEVTMTPEIRRYLQDVVVFMRLERGIDGGISPYATTSFVALAKYLAPLHRLDFVTPSLVALAARKVYPHRISIASPERERSMQYGSDLDAVKELLDGVTPETVIEAVINTVECPL